MILSAGPRKIQQTIGTMKKFHSPLLLQDQTQLRHMIGSIVGAHNGHTLPILLGLDEVAPWIQNNSKASHQQELNGLYEYFFGKDFFVCFEQLFGISIEKALEMSTKDIIEKKLKPYIFLHIPLFSGLSEKEIDNLKKSTSYGYNWSESYNIGDEGMPFSFGFLMGTPTGKMMYKHKLIIPIVNFYNTSTVDYLSDPEGKRAFSLLQKVWMLSNHDNTIHNFFDFADKTLLNGGLSSSYLDSRIFYPLSRSKIDNLYESWAIQAHRDLLYMLYKKNPELKNFVLKLGMQFADALQKISNKQVREELLEAFIYAYGRIINVLGEEFDDPMRLGIPPTINPGDPKFERLRRLMKEARTLTRYKEYESLWQRIHNDLQPKLVDPLDGYKRYATHAEVVRACDPQLFQ